MLGWCRGASESSTSVLEHGGHSCSERDALGSVLGPTLPLGTQAGALFSLSGCFAEITIDDSGSAGGVQVWRCGHQVSQSSCPVRLTSEADEMTCTIGRENIRKKTKQTRKTGLLGENGWAHHRRTETRWRRQPGKKSPKRWAGKEVTAGGHPLEEEVSKRLNTRYAAEQRPGVGGNQEPRTGSGPCGQLASRQ